MSDNANIQCKTDDKNSEIVEKQINYMSDGQIVDISRQLMRGRNLSQFEKFFNSLEVDTLSRLTHNEDFLQIFLKFKLLQGCWLDVIEILKTKERSFSKPVFLSLWDEANYQKYQAGNKGDLTTLNKYRVRQRNPPPESICPYGIRPCRLLPMKSVSVLQKWFNTHQDHPYPCKSTKAKLAKVAGIPVRKVTTWFQNCRRKFKKQLINEALTDKLHNLSSTSQQDLQNMSSTSQQDLHNLSSTSQQDLQNMSSTSQQDLQNMSSTSQQDLQNISSTSKPNVQILSATNLLPDVKYNILPQSRKIKMCDAATQSEESVILTTNPNISMVTNNIDQLDCVRKLVPMDQTRNVQITEESREQVTEESQGQVTEESQEQVTEESQEQIIEKSWEHIVEKSREQVIEDNKTLIDHNNNYDTEFMYPSKCNTGHVDKSLNDSDRMASVSMETGQSSGQDMYSMSNINITDYALPTEHCDSEAQFRYLIDACSWNEPISPPVTNVYNNCSTMRCGEIVSPLYVSPNDQIRKYHIKSPIQENTGNLLKLPDERITQSNMLNSSMNSNTLLGKNVMPESSLSENTMDGVVHGVRTSLVNNRIIDDSYSSNIVNTGRCTCMCIHTSVPNCPKSIDIVEQNCRDKWKCPQYSTCNMNTNVLPYKGLQEDKGYSWQSANHSQTISELGKNAKWKNVAECKNASEDYEWKRLDIDKTKTITSAAGRTPETSNFCDIASNTDTCIGSIGRGRHSLKHDVGTAGNLNSKNIPLSKRFNVNPNIKYVGNCRQHRNMIPSPVPYHTRQECRNRVTVSQTLKCTLKACLNKGARSFLVCDKCKDEVKDVGIESLQALQKLCNNIESSVQSPIDLAAKICCDMESEMESEMCGVTQQQLPDKDQVVPLKRYKDERPLDMRLGTEPLGKTMDDGEEVRPINLQITYEMDTNAPMRVQISPETQPISSQSMQCNITQSVSPELEGNYGSVVAEAIQGLLYMSSSQESD